MKGLIQRVSEASVSVNGQVIAQIDSGILLLLGVEPSDQLSQAKRLCDRVTRYRIFPDEQGRMNRSLLDCRGSLLVVPQFTLAADTASGNRPGFSTAAAPEDAKRLFLSFVTEATHRLGEPSVKAGEFGADMKVSLTNDGPVTFLLEAR